MKLIIAVVPNSITENTLDKLLDAGIGATKLASTGGFGKGGNTTLLIGIKDEYVEAAKNIIKSESETRKIEMLAENNNKINKSLPGSTIMVLDMEQFEHY